VDIYKVYLGLKMGKTKTRVIAAKITEPLMWAIEQYLKHDAHVSLSDFLRDAIREKLKRDAPHIYQAMLERAIETAKAVEG